MSLMRSAIVAETKTWLRTPFADGQHCKGVGVDCVGLVIGVADRLSISLPPVLPYSPQWHLHQHEEKLLNTIRAVPLEEIAIQHRQPGDIAVFRLDKGLPCSHVGIFIENDDFIHAYWSKAMAQGRVAQSRLRGAWQWQLEYVFAFPGVTA